MIPTSRSAITLAWLLLMSLTLAVIPPVDASAGGATRAIVQRFLITRAVPSGGTLSTPAISSNLVVWMQTTNRGGIATGDIYGKNLTTGHMFSVTAVRTDL